MLSLKEKIEQEIAIAYKKLALVEKHPDLEETFLGLQAFSAIPWCGLVKFFSRYGTYVAAPYYRPAPDLCVYGPSVVVLVGVGDLPDETNWQTEMQTLGYLPALIQQVATRVQTELEQS